MASLTVTENELLEALASAQHAAPEGQTINEMVETTGVTRKKVVAALRVLQKEGRLTVAQAPRLAIDGKYRPVPVYTILKKAAKR